jgi:hypothetical protein
VDVIDRFPIPIVFVLLVAVAALVYEIGYRLGGWWQDRMPGENEGPSGILIGSLLALLSFLIAITMGMAADRFDTRRALVLEESNAIWATYLRAGFLPAQQRDDIRLLLREYVPLRINVADRVLLERDFSRSEAIQAEIWTEIEGIAESQEQFETFSLFADSLNEMINVHEERVAALVYGRVPETVLLVLLFGSAVSIGVVGYSAGLTKQRSVLSAAVLIVVLGVVYTLIFDLDRPREGFIQVSQQPLIDLRDRVGPPD